MPRLRGPAIQLPPQEKRWAFLNESIYGDPLVGGHHKQPLDEVLPWSWEKAFGRQAPLMLEVGFNRGRFITELAHRNPDHNVVGIEIRRRFGILLARQCGLADDPKNLRVIWGDAKILLPKLFAAGSLSDMFVTFPDPWWKKRHEKRRLVDTQFAAEISEKLQAGGHIWVKSDVAMIADEIKEALISRPELGKLVPFEPDDLPLTHRERACIKKGLPIQRFRLTRNHSPFTGYAETHIHTDESSDHGEDRS
jgi:tRNA (guanine-N7-)-methyltransferase